MIVGIGVDVVDIDRLRRMMERVPSLSDRIFDPRELIGDDGVERRIESLAARFAAKEAVAKALGAPPGLSFRGAYVKIGDYGAPSVEVVGSVKERADALGVCRFHISLSHDAGIAIAYVVAESESESEQGGTP